MKHAVVNAKLKKAPCQSKRIRFRKEIRHGNQSPSNELTAGTCALLMDGLELAYFISRSQFFG